MVLGDIGKAAGDQPFDDLAHFGDMLGRARLDARPQRAERIDVGVKLPAGLLGDFPDRFVQRQAGEIARGAVVDLVVDVGDVADIFDVGLAIEMAQQPKQHVEHDHGPRVADMGEVIDGRSADIHADVLRIERHEAALFPAQRIVEAQFHMDTRRLLAGRPVLSMFLR
ncbi:hypothetical protein ACVWW5_005259 [Bradyrhizobium sp. LM3.4]